MLHKRDLKLLLTASLVLFLLSSCNIATRTTTTPTAGNNGVNNNTITNPANGGDAYKYNGTFDFTTITNIGDTLTTDSLQAMAIQPLDHKIVAVGTSYPDSGSSHSDFAVVRYNQNGTLDNSFGTNGKVTTDIGADTRDAATAVAIQTDGQIVVAGYSFDPINGPDFVVARYNSEDGSLDENFGINGIAITNIGGEDHPHAYDKAFAVAIQGDGKIVVAGYSMLTTTYEFAVVRYNTDGTPDDTFAIDDHGHPAGPAVGVMTTGFIDKGIHTDDFASALALQADGKIVVVGRTYVNGEASNFAVIRYNADGTLDQTFGTEGQLTTTIGENSEDIATSVAIQSDGKIIVAGYSAMPLSEDEYNFALVRYNVDGTLDGTFGTDGIAVTAFVNNAQDFANSVAIQPNGKIVVAGTTYARGWYTSDDFAVARYNTDGSLDTTFGTEGRMTIDVYGDSMDMLSSVLIDQDGKILLGGRSNVDDPSYDFVVMRLQ